MTDPAAIPDDVGIRIKFVRILRLYTQETVAGLVGVSYKAIDAIEQGRDRPDMATLEAIARALHVRSSYFLVAEHAPLTPPDFPPVPRRPS